MKRFLSWKISLREKDTLDYKGLGREECCDYIYAS